MNRRILAVVAAVSLTMLADPARAGFTIVDLGAPQATVTSLGMSINASGVVAGDLERGLVDTAVVFKNGAIIPLGTLGGENSYGYAISAAGDVVGASASIAGNPGSQHAYFWDHSTQVMTNLGTLGGATSYARGVNDDVKGVAGSVVVGESATANGGGNHAFAYYDGKMHDLGSLAAGGQSFASAINQNGLIAGTADTVATTVGRPQHAVTIDLNGVYTDLGTLGTGDLSVGLALNNSGVVVVGYSSLSLSDHATVHAFATFGGTMMDLGTLGGASSVANAINDRGDVVGYSNTTKAGDNHAFLYRNGAMVDLNTLIDSSLGWELMFANGINDAGQITGYGTVDGRIHAFLLNEDAPAVPEPSSLVLLAGGLATAAVFGRRRRRG
jgi:probable HAF family extracellular repeat protein